jgi:hypothetical protein
MFLWFPNPFFQNHSLHHILHDQNPWEYICSLPHFPPLILFKIIHIIMEGKYVFFLKLLWPIHSIHVTEVTWPLTESFPKMFIYSLDTSL